MVGPRCMQEAAFTKSQGKTVIAHSEQGTARALSGIMRRKSIRAKHKNPLREGERGKSCEMGGGWKTIER